MRGTQPGQECAELTSVHTEFHGWTYPREGTQAPPWPQPAPPTTHTHTHACMHTYMHTGTHRHIHTCTHIHNPHTHICTQAHTSMYTHARICTIHIHTYAHRHTLEMMYRYPQPETEESHRSYVLWKQSQDFQGDITDLSSGRG